MNERAWVQRPDRQMVFKVLRSSEGRWHGFETYLYEATDGYSDVFMSDHCVSMYVGAPTLVRTRCDGASLSRLQVPGDLKVIPAGYSRVWEIATTTRKIVVELSPPFVRSVAHEMGLDPDHVHIAPQLHVTDKRIEYLTWALAAEMEAEERAGAIYAESLATALSAQLLRHYASVVGRRITGGLPKRRLQRVIDYIQENIGQDLTLFELAGVANISASHFKTLFKQSTGLPVHQYVIRARVEHALELILRTGEPLSEIALRSGFANQSHLARSMRRLRGITPAELRRESQ